MVQFTSCYDAQEQRYVGFLCCIPEKSYCIRDRTRHEEFLRYGPTYLPRDRPSYRDARTHLKNCNSKVQKSFLLIAPAHEHASRAPMYPTFLNR